LKRIPLLISPSLGLLQAILCGVWLPFDSPNTNLPLIESRYFFTKVLETWVRAVTWRKPLVRHVLT
jgi:hypothetical protein